MERLYLLDAEIRERWRSEQPIYDALGRIICEQISDRIAELGVDGKYLLRVPMSSRLKEENSLIDKALYRKKYASPYEGITDKVGVRLVVLTDEEIPIVEEILKGLPDFNIKGPTNDFREKREKEPTKHEYQGVHYELFLKSSRPCGELTIGTDCICEVQVKTLLQHAVSELSHDTTYKSDVIPQPNVQRIVSNCISLAETTSYLFSLALDEVKKENQQWDDFTSVLIKEYKKLHHAPIRLDRDLQRRLLLALRDMSSEEQPELIENLISFVSEKESVLRAAIDKGYDNSLLYGQPIILFLYYLIKKFPNRMRVKWPYLEELLEPLYLDLGLTPPSAVGTLY
jgi:putative GTP pyrophosphokinase